MEIQLRKMTEEDRKEVSAIYLEGIESNKATFETVCPTYEEWDKGHLEQCRIVAEIDKEVAGWVALSPVSNRYVYRGVAEISLYIANKYQHKGIGKKLLERVCTAAEEEGFWTLQSSIMADNKPSLDLHEKCGFRTVGYREKHGQDQHGNWRDTVLVEKRSIHIV